MDGMWGTSIPISDPEVRPTATQLLEHMFADVNPLAFDFRAWHEAAVTKKAQMDAARKAMGEDDDSSCSSDDLSDDGSSMSDEEDSEEEDEEEEMEEEDDE